jgi:hypothetical protein
VPWLNLKYYLKKSFGCGNMAKEFAMLPRLLVILVVLLFPVMAHAYHGETLVQLKSFSAEVIDDNNQRSWAPITIFV